VRGSVYALAEDYIKKDLLFAGTEFGVFATIDSGKSWKPLKGGMPTIAVRDIAIQKRESDLVLASFGRGFFILDDYSPLRHLDEATLQKEAAVFPVKDAWMFVESYPLGGLGSKEKGFQGEMYFSAPNPPLGAVITYYLKEGIQTLKEKRAKEEKDVFEKNQPIPYPTYERAKAEDEEETPFLLFQVADEDGNPVRQLRAPATAGLHRIVWDFHYASTDKTNLEEAKPEATGPSGILAMPGKYRVSLAKSVNGLITTLTDPAGFSAVTLGNTVLPAENRAELVTFQKRVTALSRSVNAASDEVEALGQKIKHFKAAVKGLTQGGEEVSGGIRSVEKKINEIRMKLYGDSILPKIDKDGEPGIVERVNTVVSDHWRSTSAPTESQRQAFEIVAAEFPPVLEALKQVAEVDIKQIEKKLDGLGAPSTPGRLPEWKR